MGCFVMNFSTPKKEKEWMVIQDENMKWNVLFEKKITFDDVKKKKKKGKERKKRGVEHVQ